MTMEFRAIYDEAIDAAKAAVAAEDLEGAGMLDCGFAWVTIEPRRSDFVSWCRMRNPNTTGWRFWSPAALAGFCGESIRIHEAAANAFAATLMRHGLKASVDSRLD